MMLEKKTINNTRINILKLKKNNKWYTQLSQITKKRKKEETFQNYSHLEKQNTVLVYDFTAWNDLIWIWFSRFDNQNAALVCWKNDKAKLTKEKNEFL